MSSRRDRRPEARPLTDGEAESAPIASQRSDERGPIVIVRPGNPGVSGSGHLPAQPTSIVGRDRDVETAREEIIERGARLLTLSGPPGVGKTRLAVEIADGLADSFEHGGFFVDLAPISDARQVAVTMSRALGIWEDGRNSVDDTLHGFLRDRHTLILLDNFEQVVDAAPFLAELLADCPHLVLLVTSRTALRLRWEHELPVAPLELPDLEVSPPAGWLAENPAIALFMDRARAIRSDFGLS